MELRKLIGFVTRLSLFVIVVVAIATHLLVTQVSAETQTASTPIPCLSGSCLDPQLAPYSDQIGSLVSNLSHDYTIQAGVVHYLTVQDCQNMPTCYGNNPSSPYGLYYFPLYSDEAQLGDQSVTLPGTTDWYANWHLGPQDAVVYIGITPSNLKYFSFRSYLFSRQSFFGRKSLFASMGDSINNLTIHTSGNSTSPFGQLTAIITTADKTTNSDIFAALSDAGFPSDIANTDIVPANLPLRLGYSGYSDDFTMLNRVGAFASQQEMEEYTSHPPAIVFRIRPKRFRFRNSFPTPDYTSKTTGVTEDQSNPGLSDALNDLKNAIIVQNQNLNVSTTSFMSLKTLIGQTCIQYSYNCLGDNWDVAYMLAYNQRNTLSEDPNDFYYVLGVNHNLTGKTVYTNFSIYNSDNQTGVVSVTNDNFPGSAIQFLPQNPLNGYLYAYKIARNCNGEQYCVEVSTQFPGVGLTEPLSVAERAYLNPLTKVGPDYDEIVNPILLHFTP